MRHLRSPGGLSTTLAAAVFVAGLTAVSAPASAAPDVNGVYAVPGIGTNNLIAPGPDGNMWVTLASDGDVARITPTGDVTRFDIAQVSGPVGITTGPDGRLWVTQPGKVAAFAATDPQNATIVPIADITDARGITTGPDGNLWTASGDKVIRIPPADPASAVSFDSAATGITGARSITSTTTHVWVGATDKVVSLAADGTPTAYPVRTNSAIQGIWAAPSGVIGFTDPAVAPNVAGLLSSGGVPQLTQTPQADPFGITYGADGAFWIAQFAGGNLGRLTPQGNYRQLAGFPSGSAKPRQIAAGPGGRLWVTLDAPGEPELSKVARVIGVTPAPAPSPVPQTTITSSPKKRIVLRKSQKKAKVRFRFASSPAGATFKCRLKRTGASSAGWDSCRSGKASRVGPGRYTFSVWATLAGKTDLSPAVARFTVVPPKASKRNRS